MGTKNKPGDYDCYENAKPDEPMFVLLGRDPVAAFLVALWAEIREQVKPGEDQKMLDEARECAKAMFQWAVDEGKRDALDRVTKIFEAFDVRL